LVSLVTAAPQANNSRQLALLCGLKSFTTTDLTRPDPHRLRTVLSGVMNFAKFREDKQGLHLALSQRAHGEMDRAVDLRRKLDRVEAAIGDIA
jgi:kinetochore protein Nuf2